MIEIFSYMKGLILRFEKIWQYFQFFSYSSLFFIFLFYLKFFVVKFRESTLISLRSLINQVHQKLTVEILKSAYNVAEKHMKDSMDDGTIIAAAALYGEAVMRMNKLNADFLKGNFERISTFLNLRLSLIIENLSFRC